MPADLQAALAAARDTIANVIDAQPPFGAEPIDSATRYALLGGKGLRGFLVMEGARLHGLRPEDSAHAAAAIECLHAYSLIHDDLPCMDDDDLRRGRATVHRKWDEATAVLAGDALQSVAFALILGAPYDAETRVILGETLAIAAQHMVSGQALDIAAESADAPLSLTEIEALQAQKTGALFRWSASAGPILAGADPRPMDAYGQAMGRAFQIADDVLDATGTAEEVGKAVGKDAGRGKATFVDALGLDGARKMAGDLMHEAIAALEPYGDDAETLRELARFTVTRRA